ncbi:hypothetical protein ES703_94218 [subsurface metagenome]
MDYRQRVKKWKKSFGPDGMKLGDFWQKPPPKPRDNDTWGPWEYDAASLVLWCKGIEVADEYWIDLKGCNNAREILDWIVQINGKGWGAECVGYLVQALDDILDLQRNIVHLPPGKTFDVKEHLAGD